jgi:hypothetical protein
MLQRVVLQGYLRELLGGQPTQPARRIDELLPHRWQPQNLTC